jgi:pseudouridine kinase
VLTRGAAGVLLADADGVREVPAVPARVRDVTGAGDALVAGVLAGLAAGEGLTRAAAVGTLVAAHTVRSEGSVCPDLSAGLVGLAGSPGESFRVREEQQ